MRRLLVLLAMVVIAPLLAAHPALADHCSKWDRNCLHTEKDQEEDAVVTTGVQFPGVDADSALGQATAANANCTNCEWTISPACVRNGPTEVAMCAEAATSCVEAGDIRYRVYLRQPPGPWQLVDTVCLGPGERPTSVADVGELVRERVVNYLPDANPSFQPAQGGIVNLPTIFAANEPKQITTESFDVLGFEIVVTADARWEWQFEDGATSEFSEPGGEYPDDSVSYEYTASGPREVSVTTYWKATFTMNGDGPFAVPGEEISKTAGPLTVPVRQARAQLVGG